MVQRTLYSFFVVVIYSLTAIHPTYASRDIIDDSLQSMYLKVDVKTAEDNLTNAMQKGDLYTQSYKLAKSNITKKTLDVIEQTKDFLNNNYAYPYTCELTYADTAIILYQNKDIRPRINQLIQAPTPGNIDVYYDQFYTSCLKLTTCLHPKEQKQFYETQNAINSCITDASQAFLLAQQNAANINEIKQAGLGENVYIDGDKNNSSYDLLLDIEAISKILFKQPKPAPRGLYYELPTVRATNKKDKTQTSSQSGTQGEEEGDGQEEGEDLEGATDSSDVDSPTTPSTTTQNPTTPTQSIDDLLEDLTPQAQTTVPLVNDGPLALANNCVLPEDIVAELGDDKESENIREALEQAYVELENERDDLTQNSEPERITTEQQELDQLAKDQASDSDASNEQQSGKPTTPVQCKQTCGDTDNQRAKELCEVKCCTASCSENFKGADKLVCISQCLCGEITGPKKDLNYWGEWTPQFRYKVRFCRIPVQTQPIVPKSVQSIEEIIDELSAVIVGMKESGKLMKHVKTKEMYETSMQNIKFGDIIAFNFFFKLKPIFNTTPEATIKEIRESDNKKREQQLRDVRGTMDIKEERNKYLLLSEPEQYDATYGVATNYTMLQENVENIEKKLQSRDFSNQDLVSGATHERIRALLGDEIANFIQNNTTFWHQTSETLQLFNDVAENLKLKIEKSPN